MLCWRSTRKRTNGRCSVPRSTPDEQVWHQPAEPVGLPLDELDGWISLRSDQTVLEAWDDPKIQAGIADERVHKDELELSLLRTAALTSKSGFDWVYGNVSPGMTEREIQVGMEAEFFRAGAVRTGLSQHCCCWL